MGPPHRRCCREKGVWQWRPFLTSISEADTLVLSRVAPRCNTSLGRDWKIAWVFLLPLLAVLIGLVAYPFVAGIILSLQHKVVGQPPIWVGLRNFRELLVGEQYSATFWNSVRVSITYTGVAVLIKLVIGMCMALLLNEKFRGQTLMRAVLFLPWAVPTIIVALTWRWIYDGSPSGLINDVRIAFFEQKTLIQFLADPNLALWSVIVVAIWQGTPFFTMMMLAAMQAIPSEQYEAAALDGASARRPLPGYHPAQPDSGDHCNCAPFHNLDRE